VRETGTVGSASSFDGEISYGTDNLWGIWSIGGGGGGLA
jgi:hypothetical protein